MSVLEQANRIAQEEVMWKLDNLRERATICGCEVCVNAYNTYLLNNFSRKTYETDRIYFKGTKDKKHIPII